MRRLPIIFCGLFAVGTLLAGCATTPQDIAYKKLGASTKRQHSDSQACWAKAQSARAPEGVEAAQAIGTIIGAGLVGVAVLMASKAAENADPKNVFRRDAHSKCMTKLGYKATGLVPPSPPGQSTPNKTSPRKSKVAGSRKRAPRIKRPQCYTFRQCMNLCRDDNLPGITTSNAYCSSTCTNTVPIC
ncbi:MAG: hypothetical protein JXQ99_08800 [Hyphomicrobiaceae bacterium]